jgi:hypothetical protein
MADERPSASRMGRLGKEVNESGGCIRALKACPERSEGRRHSSEAHRVLQDAALAEPAL